MCVIADISKTLCPVPQQVSALEGAPLAIKPGMQWNLQAHEAEKGPAKTAREDLIAFLKETCGEDCFADNGIPVTLALEEAPAEVAANPKEAYCLKISADGITLTGFGPSGLYYGVNTLLQLAKWEQIPAVQILDWPDNCFRAFKEECRYGSNVMEKEDWFALIDDLASKRYNRISIGIYGCWVVQFDGKVAEYLYLPLKDYPQLKTPQNVRYYSPTEGRWISYETLPPIFRDNFFGELVRYAKDRGIDMMPGINSLGHNTLFPANLPEVAPKDENGRSVPSGFCTSSEDTYKLLFSVYDQLIDDYLLPNDIHCFNIMLDEVHDEAGVNAERKYEVLSPWCKCEKCRAKSKKDIFIDHIVKVVSHMKEKGMDTIYIAHDMLIKKSSNMGYIGDDLLAALEKAGLRDVVLLGWWCYVSNIEHMDFTDCHDELGLRSTCNPWNGYYIWSVLTNPMGNVKIMADMNRKTAKGEGINMYSLWDKSCDRIHDCTADYNWNYAGAGQLEDVTKRYVARHFPGLYDKCLYAFRQIDWICEERLWRKDPDNPKWNIMSRQGLLLKTLTYYSYCYFDPNKPYPRHFPGEALEKILLRRHNYERELFSIAAQAKEAIEIFQEAAQTENCDKQMAKRMEYECWNYLCLARDWLDILRMYDLTQSGEIKAIAPIARACYERRLSVMKMCEQVKEKWAREGAAMRDLSVLLQAFADIADYIERTEDPHLDLMDITPIMSKESWEVR